VQPPTYPGGPEHQRLLQAIAEYYADDNRVLAVIVFGSVGRGTWDEYSDLDLDVVVADAVKLDVPGEVRRLCDGLGQVPVVIVPDRDDAADVVLASLMEFSIRYHPLRSTNANIVESMVVLTGRLDHAEIAAAGLKNRRPHAASFADLLGACIRQAVTLDAKLHRRKFWLAYLVLYEARDRLLRLVAASRGAQRPYHLVDAISDQSLRVRLGRTLPHDDLPSLQEAFIALLDVLDHDLEALTAGQARLTHAQRQILAQLRARQANLNLSTAR
jgi:predicted nucleotidyltransferase